MHFQQSKQFDFPRGMAKGWKEAEGGGAIAKCKCDGLRLEFRTQTWTRNVAPRNVAPPHCTTSGQPRPGQARPLTIQFPVSTTHVVCSFEGFSSRRKLHAQRVYRFLSGQIAFRYDSHAPWLRPFQVSNSPAARCATTRVHCSSMPAHHDDDQTM